MSGPQRVGRVGRPRGSDVHVLPDSLVRLVLLAPALVASLIAYAWAGVRGVNAASLWQFESIARYAAWRDDPSEEALAFASVGETSVFPFVGWLASMFADPASIHLALRPLVALSAGATVYAVGVLGRRAGGFWVGLLASVLLMGMPRFWAVVSVPGPSVFAMAAVAVMCAVLVVVRERGRWALVGVPLVAVALATTIAAWWMLFAAFVALFVAEGRVGGRGGSVEIRPTTIGALLVLPIGMALAFMLMPEWREGGATALGESLAYGLSRPADAFLYMGKLYGAERIPVHAAPVLWMMTLPAGVAILALAGLGMPSSLVPAGAGARDARIFFVGVWSMVWVLRSPTHVGQDLLAVGLPFIAVLAAIGASGLLTAARLGTTSSRWRSYVSGGAMAVVAMATLSSLGSVVRHHDALESSYNAWVGGTSGAVVRGLDRGPGRPMPPALLEQIPAGDGVGIVIDAMSLHDVLVWTMEGTGSEAVLRDASNARWLIVAHQDANPAYYAAMRALIDSMTEVSRETVWDHEGVPLWTLIRVR